MFPSHSLTWWDDNYWFLSLHNFPSFLIEQVHLDYLEVGADIIITTSYGLPGNSVFPLICLFILNCCSG